MSNVQRDFWWPDLFCSDSMRLDGCSIFFLSPRLTLPESEERIILQLDDLELFTVLTVI